MPDIGNVSEENGSCEEHWRTCSEPLPEAALSALFLKVLGPKPLSQPTYTKAAVLFFFSPLGKRKRGRLPEERRGKELSRWVRIM